MRGGGKQETAYMIGDRARKEEATEVQGGSSCRTENVNQLREEGRPGRSGRAHQQSQQDTINSS